MTEALMTAEEVAALLGMGVDWVYSETRAGRIPYVPLGRYRRYRRESIEAWLRELEAGTIGPDGVKRPRGRHAVGGMAEEG